MPLQNTIVRNVDFKKRNLINEPEVYQNDEVLFIINVYDDGKEFDLSGVSTSTLVSERPDKQSVMTLGEITGTNQITFELGSTEISKVGKVDAVIQLYDADGRVTTMSFTYKVLKDPGTGYIPSTDEQTLIELVLGEGPAILDAAEQATLDAQSFIANYGRREEFDNTALYKKGNEVGYDGSSYVALQDTQGNLPTDTTYWALRARKGLGDVNSVNNVLPDGNGNVTITIPDPDLSGLATKDELQMLDDEVTAHLVDGAVNVKNYGAVGDGVTDDTNTIQSAINFAQINNKSLYIPSGRYKTTTPLLITKRIKLFGEGMDQSKIVYSGTGSAISIQPPTNGSSNTFYEFSNFGVEPLVNGSGVHGIDIVLNTNAYFSNWELHRVYIGDFGSYGLHLGNDVPNVDGFFTGTIRKCWITNGINGSNLGDSITIAENTITGRNTGILTSHLSGARQVVIRENNITTMGGGIALIGAEQPMIYNNQIEHPAYKGNYTGVYDAMLYLVNTSLAEIRGNTIAPSISTVVGTNFGILFEGNSTHNIITCNNIAKGELYHVGFAGASTLFNMIKEDNTFDSTPVILNESINNVGVDISLAPLNGWTAYEIGSELKIKKLENGMIVMHGYLKGGAITSGTLLTTLPVGFRPSSAKRYSVVNFNGSAYSNSTVLINTLGEVLLLSAVSNVLLHLDGIQFFK